MVETIEQLKESTVAKLKEGSVIVTFNKLNGDKRVMTCTLKEGVIPPATKEDTASQKKVRAISEETQVVWDTNANGWRSFRWENVIEVNDA